MSRLAKKSIKLPQDVSMEKNAGVLVFKGAKGELKLKTIPGTEVVSDGVSVSVRASAGDAPAASVGTMWSLIKNSLEGVSVGFSKVLELEGVGYKAVAEGNDLVLSLGYAQPVRVKLPQGISLKIEKNTITISGLDKELVGRTAAGVRALKKPEPYKGKGIHYKGEVIRRKVGKKAAAATGAA